MTYKIKKPPLLASVLTIAALGLLGSLGTWQAQKYLIKTKSADNPACQREAPYVVRGDFNSFDKDYAYIGCENGLSIQAWVQDDVNIAVGPRVHDGTPGYHIYKPMMGDENTTILVNFGWSETKELNLDSAALTVTGTLLKPSGPNYFTPDNKADINEWYWVDLDGMKTYYDLTNLSDYVLFANSIKPDNTANIIPATFSKSTLTPQSHLQYAGFWYFMGLALLVIFIFRFVLNKKDEN